MPGALRPSRHGLPDVGRCQHGVDAAAAHHPGGVRNAGPHHQLRLTDGEDLRRGDVVARARPEVGEHDPARMFVLRCPHQAPDRGTGQVGDVLARQRDRAAGDDQQLRRRRLGEPGLQPLERAAGWRCGRLPPESAESLDTGTVSYSTTPSVASSAPSGAVTGDHSHLEEFAVTAGTAGEGELVGADRPGGHRADGQHGEAEAVGQVDGHRVRARRGDAGPHGRRPRGVEGHVLPRERQCQLVIARSQCHRVQRRVEQYRVDPELGGLNTLRDGDFGEHLVASMPHGGQRAEGRAVLVTACGERLVGVGHVDRDGARGRPCGQVGTGRGRRRPHHCLGVQHPGGVLVAGPGEHRHRARARIIARPDQHPDRYARRRDHQRRLQGQLLDDRAPHLVARPDDQLDETGPGEQDHAVHRVVGQPRLRGDRQPAGEHDLARLRHLDDRAEQRVRGAGQPQSGGVRGSGAPAGQPEPAPLEGIRRQVGEPAARRRRCASPPRSPP